jgi:hypothetical protein
MPPTWPSFLPTSPKLRRLLLPRDVNITNPATMPDYLVAQWYNPSDILSIILLLELDIAQRAVAQLAGRTVTPLHFRSAGVAYAVSALLSAFGAKLAGFRPKVRALTNPN